MALDDKLARELKEAYERRYAAGELLSRDRLAQHYATFRERFGPEQLQNLDGEALLETIHNHSNYDSLVYWLEFKNDEELPAMFGSIAGGSALKFGIYRRKETGAWTAGSPQKQIELPIDQAVQVARRHRDQLVRGAELLEQFPANGSDTDYRHLQEQMDNIAPDVSRAAWGHKYFSLLYPEKLDNYHVEYLQRFHLIKLLQVPPEGDGRYLVAGRYVAIARELGIHLNQLAEILNGRNGPFYRYWRVLVNHPDQAGWENQWDILRAGGFVAIGWDSLGDLSGIQHNQESKVRLQQLMKTHYGDKGGWANEIFNFCHLQEGDLVLAFEKTTVLGIGRVSGGYVYAPEPPEIPHRHSVEWLDEGRWELPVREAVARAVRELKHPANLVEVERRILGIDRPIRPPIAPIPTTVPHLSGIPGRVQTTLERKKQVILYGPPGTGKTYWARIAALDLAAYSCFGQPFAQLPADQQHLVIHGGDGAAALVRMCTFHPAYGYEDFIEGYRPKEVQGQLAFDCQDGILKKLCQDAGRQPQQAFYLIIDEINRGDIPRIFGELLTLLEKDKRDQSVLLPLSGQPFQVPDNVYVIGTMNTADRSIALLDTALRRRFGFVELMPDPAVLGAAVVENSIPLGPWLAALNERILEHIGRDARNLQIGHAYFLDNGQPIVEMSRFARVVQDDIVPLLEEYCYEDYVALAKILGSALVDVARQRVRHELFAPDRRDDLIQALLAPSPDIAASAQAIASEREELDQDAEENHDEEETA